MADARRSPPRHLRGRPARLRRSCCPSTGGWRRGSPGSSRSATATLAADRALETEPDRPAEHSASAFLTGHAPGRGSTARTAHGSPTPATCGPTRPTRRPAGGPPATTRTTSGCRWPPTRASHPLRRRGPHAPRRAAAPADPAAMAHLRAQYFGMVSEVDDQLGRVLDHLVATGQEDETVVVVTADHGEQLGDHGLIQKLGFYESSYAIPCIVRAPGRAGPPARWSRSSPRPSTCSRPSAELAGPGGAGPVRRGVPRPLPRRGRARSVADAAHWEWDWRDMVMGPHRDGRRTRPPGSSGTTSRSSGPPPTPTCSSATARGSASTWPPTPGGAPRPTDPATWCCRWPSRWPVWRQEHLDRTYTAMLLSTDRVGR